jgi:putative nucleotidyltransferase with HDIG domain
MKVRKIRSVKQASFYGMLGGSLVFVAVSFAVFIVFLITLGYLFISGQESNLSYILINNLEEKQGRIISVADSLAETIAEGRNPVHKGIPYEKAIVNNKDIQGVLILDKSGIITEGSTNFKEYVGLDFSGKDYYREIINNDIKSTIVSDSYVSHKTKKLSLNVVSPIIKDNQVQGMVVILINPSIIENRELRDMEYFLIDSNGDIIFQSSEKNIITREDNIKSTLLMKSGLDKSNAMVYRDKITNELVLGIIRKGPLSSMYVVVQYHLFGNKTLINSILLMVAISASFIFLFILVVSSQASSVVTKYISLFKDEVKKISAGNYDIKLSDRYPHEEINEIIDSFNYMAQKVKVREEELQAYNEELIAANDEIKAMLSALSKNEKDRKEQYLQIIWTMVNLLEIKDEYTAGHSKSVTYYAEEIAERLNKNYGFKLNVEKIQIAAILHDIGKIGIDKDILNKPSRLSKDEYEVIKTHPSKGYYALKDIESLKEERKIIKYHHERYDGLGYPEGLKGDLIPLGARIICVADAFDAMVSDRPYRKGLPIQVAISELVKNKGTQFDPLIVDVFSAMLLEEQGLHEQEA